MKKVQALQYIVNAMSLREPQKKSLFLFADYLETKAGRKVLLRIHKDKISNIGETEKLTRDYAQTILETRQFQGFERTFPAYTFALATGVGKTRLMGAFVTYLSLVYGIQNFLLVAPGNTIYRKLVDDFSKANNPKYVFKGINEININTTHIITKDNYGSRCSRVKIKDKIYCNQHNKFSKHGNFFQDPPQDVRKKYFKFNN